MYVYSAWLVHLKDIPDIHPMIILILSHLVPHAHTHALFHVSHLHSNCSLSYTHTHTGTTHDDFWESSKLKEALYSQQVTYVAGGPQSGTCMFAQVIGCFVVSIVSFDRSLSPQGALVSALADDSIHLWNLRQKRPAVLHSLKFNRERWAELLLPSDHFRNRLYNT